MKRFLILPVILIMLLPLGAKNFLSNNEGAESANGKKEEATFILTSDLYSNHSFGITTNKVASHTGMISKTDEIQLVRDSSVTEKTVYKNNEKLYFSFIVKGNGQFVVTMTAEDIVGTDDPGDPKAFRTKISVTENTSTGGTNVLVIDRNQAGEYNTITVWDSSKRGSGAMNNEYGSYPLEIEAVYYDRTDGKDITEVNDKPIQTRYNGRITMRCTVNA